MQPRETLKTYFQTGDKPTEAQFAELINSLRHRTEDPVLWSEITGRPSSFPSAWADITGKPSFATVATSGSYADLAGIPSTFAPAAHTHSAGEITTGTFHPARLAAGTTTDGKMIQILSGVATWVDAPSGGSSGWGSLSGVAGTAGTEILGTSDNKRVRIAANGQTKLWINPGIAGGTGVPSLGSMGNAALAVMSGASDLFGTVHGTDNVTGNGYIQAQRIDGTATAFNLHLQPSGGNVGIGNTNAVYKLDLTGSMRISSIPTITNAATVMVPNPSTGELSKQAIVQWGASANTTGGGVSLGDYSAATGFLSNAVGAYMNVAANQAIGFGRGNVLSGATCGILLSGFGGTIRQPKGIGIGFGVDVTHEGAFLLWDQGDFSTYFTSDAVNQFKTKFSGGYKFQTGTTAAPVTQFEILSSGMVALYNIPTYADKAAATIGIGRANVIFQTPTGMLGIS